MVLDYPFSVTTDWLFNHSSLSFLIYRIEIINNPVHRAVVRMKYATMYTVLTSGDLHIRYTELMLFMILLLF